MFACVCVLVMRPQQGRFYLKADFAKTLSDHWDVFCHAYEVVAIDIPSYNQQGKDTQFQAQKRNFLEVMLKIMWKISGSLSTHILLCSTSSMCGCPCNAGWPFMNAQYSAYLMTPWSQQRNNSSALTYQCSYAMHLQGWTEDCVSLPLKKERAKGSDLHVYAALSQA